MNRIALSSIFLCMVSCISALCGAMEISTFLVHEDTSHNMAVGPEGALWLCLGHPPRMVKISGDEVEEVPFNGHIELRNDWGADVYFTLLGEMLVLEQGAEDGVDCNRSAYYFDEQEGLSYSGIIFPPATTCDGLLFDAQGKKYAVMSFGGFLGIGERYHPLPWATLKYDTRLGGYVVGVPIEQLKGAPTYAATETPAWGDRAYEVRIHEYYKTVPYWGV